MAKVHFWQTFCAVRRPPSAVRIRRPLPHFTESSVDVIITRDPASPFCPVKAMLDYCKVRLFAPGPLFCFRNRPVTVTQFNEQIRARLSFCSLDSNRYKSHSFRIGAACHAADLGYTDSQIRALGRCKSDVFKLYIRNETLATN